MLLVEVHSRFFHSKTEPKTKNYFSLMFISKYINNNICISPPHSCPPSPIPQTPSFSFRSFSFFFLDLLSVPVLWNEAIEKMDQHWERVECELLKIQTLYEESI